MKNLIEFLVYAVLLLGLAFGVLETARISVGVSITVAVGSLLVAYAISGASVRIVDAINGKKPGA